MHGSILILIGLLALLVLVSLALDSYRCTLLSKSGLALLFGGLVGFGIASHAPDVAVHLNFDHSFFFDVLLPPIIYEAGFSVERTTFFRNFGAILTTAIWGTLVSACVTGLVLYAASAHACIPPLDWTETFLFGALLSAVDPVATLACFQKVSVPPVLFNIVFGESVLNDAVAIALYKALLSVARAGGGMSVAILMLVVVQTFGILVGSICVSLLMTLAGASLFVGIPALRAYPVYEILLCTCVSLSTYFAAELCALSGIVALFFSGILTAHYHYHVMSPVAQVAVHHVLQTSAFVCDTLVYVYVGLATAIVLHDTSPQSPLQLHDVSWPLVGWTTFSLLVGRFLNIFPLVGLTNHWHCNQDVITPRMMLVMWLAGLRGAVAVALVTDWPYVRASDGVDNKSLMVTTTLFIVIGSTWIVGGLTAPLLHVCGLITAAPSSTVPDRSVPPAARRMSTLDDSPTTSRCAMFRITLASMWLSFDELYMKPIFGGKPTRRAKGKIADDAGRASLLERDVAATEHR
ncbi:Aste57867_10449 [Aphanomyces stellatus]|uniref:Aste57867_10449 protein n=1 Tax=Aphanomyces stellatus TaxID=120398 RepID=A0A485KRD4_9STRA|nr:hypothetical protein As57867_010409 [Aphanomyces stellatus]VFT87323.1 Aste57867_10449 [Aphanomyces stellatus]